MASGDVRGPSPSVTLSGLWAISLEAAHGIPYYALDVFLYRCLSNLIDGKKHRT